MMITILNKRAFIKNTLAPWNKWCTSLIEVSFLFLLPERSNRGNGCESSQQLGRYLFSGHFGSVFWQWIQAWDSSGHKKSMRDLSLLGAFVPQWKKRIKKQAKEKISKEEKWKKKLKQLPLLITSLCGCGFNQS